MSSFADESLKSLKFKQVYKELNLKTGDNGFKNYVVLFYSEKARLYLSKSECKRWTYEFIEDTLIPEVEEGMSVFESASLAKAVRLIQNRFDRNNKRLKAYLEKEVIE